jgi:two-component system, sensor histidine kinase and response regulator
MKSAKPRILIADSDKKSVILLDQILRAEGFNTIVCETGSAAWQAFERHEPAIVIVDWVLPEINGLDLCRKLRADPRGKHIYIMFLTARGLRENIVAGINGGADDYMVKPFYAEELKARVRAGERMVSLQKQLLERNTMLEELVYTVTHDLRTPLIAMDMTAQQAADGLYGELPASYGRILDTTRRSLKDLLGMVDNLLSVARYESGKGVTENENSSIVKVCQECMSELSPIYSRKNLQVNLTSNAQEVQVKVNRRDLRRVILNLLDNAIKFTPNKGEVRISVELAADKVIVQIQDSGLGIKKEEAKQLFERFARAKSTRHAPGTGLGLYLCRRIIESHGGVVDCIPRPSEGTTVSFLLPVSASK